MGSFAALLLALSLAQAQPVLIVSHHDVPVQRHALASQIAPADPVSGVSRTEITGPTYIATLTEKPDGLLRQVEIAIRYTKPVFVDHESLELDLPADGGRAVWRDGRLHDLPPVLHTDRWMPKLVELHAPERTVLIIGGNEIEGLSVVRHGHTAHIVLELDETADHPFSYESSCRTNWHIKAPRHEHSTRYRAENQTVLYRFWIGEPAASSSPPISPLLPQRFPDGFAAAFAFTDHADQSSLATLRALLYGSSDERAERYGRGGFFGHHLRLTKALFFSSSGAAQPQLEDPRVQELALEMTRAGSEVVPHSATPGPDSRDVTETALRYFSTLAARTWIDHQVETNCEAFTNGGWKPGGPFYLADLLAQHGYRYIWSGRDPTPPGGELDLLATDHPEARAPWLFLNGPAGPGAPQFWLWRSEWAFIDSHDFYARYAPAQLDRLEARRGLHVAHTYLESLHASGPQRDKHVLLHLPDGSVATDAPFEQLLADLERRQALGSLWVTTLGELADHTLAMSQVELRYETDGSVIVHNEGSHLVHGATFFAPRPIRVDGTTPLLERKEGEGVTFWLDLEPERDYRITTEGGFVR